MAEEKSSGNRRATIEETPFELVVTRYENDEVVSEVETRSLASARRAATIWCKGGREAGAVSTGALTVLLGACVLVLLAMHGHLVLTLIGMMLLGVGISVAAHPTPPRSVETPRTTKPETASLSTPVIKTAGLAEHRNRGCWDRETTRVLATIDRQAVTA